MVACSVRTKDGTIRDWKEQSTFRKKLNTTRPATRDEIVVWTGGDGRRVGASFLHLIGRLFTLTLCPRRGFRRALSPRRVPSARPLRLAPWASGVAPGLIRTARARATIVQESAKCENTDFRNSWRPFLALERSSEKAFKNAKHGSQLLRSSS